jgi:muconolactone delta-isomerase
MRFLVIAGALEPLDLSTVGDAPARANDYRAGLVADGRIVEHAHVAGQRAHMWLYEVDGVDELDRVMAGDPMAPFTSGTPQIVALASPERMAERAAGAGR